MFLRADSKYSDQTAQSDLSSRAHMSFCWFRRAAAHIEN